jgi:L-threonylcarbamoyladenylate synthase
MVRVAWENAAGPWLAPIARVIREGGVAVIPTDTLYGFAARADRPAAVERVAVSKGRDASAPFLLLLSAIAELQAVAAAIPPSAVLARVWPGPVTVLLRARPDLDPRFRSEAGTVAARLPDDTVLRSLLGAIGAPILSTSVNRHGSPPLADPAAIAHEFGAEIDLLADQGMRRGEPSTIVDLSRRPPALVRAGARAVDPVELERTWKRAQEAEMRGGAA